MADSSHRLVVLRHAKSAWPDGVPDEERPLGKRGRKDARAVGRWLQDRAGPIEVVVCSPAARTRQTWQLVTTVLAGVPDPIFDDRVYAASVDTLLTVVKELPDDAGSAILIGHNPGVADLVELLSGESPRMPTSAIAVLDLPSPWADAKPGRAELVAHAAPRG